MDKDAFGTEEDTEEEVVTGTPVRTPRPRKPRTRKAPAKAVSTRRLTAKTKYQTVQGIVAAEKAVTETTTVGELLGVLKERVFEEAVG